MPQSSATATDCGISTDADLNTSRPSITARCFPWRISDSLMYGSCASPGASTHRSSAWRPSANRCVESTPRAGSSVGPRIATPAPSPNSTAVRSEEHTSELQSQSNLVCRLLLEKKKKNTQHTQQHT